MNEADYITQARTECRAFANQIRKHYGEPDGGELRIKGQRHDSGTYYEVVAYFDSDDEEATRWAFDIEGDKLGVLDRWDAEFMPKATA